MGFKEVQDLDCEVTTALGGRNKKTGKANPTKVEGYYIGSKDVASPKSKTGKAKLHIFQTDNGNLGVWGKTDLDRKMSAASIGAMTRVTQSGMVPTPNGDMYKYKVEVDTENTIEVNFSGNSGAEASDESYAEEETSLDADEAALDEVAAIPAKRPAVAASVNAERQAKVEALLRGSRKQS